MTSTKTHQVSKGKSNRPNQLGKQQIMSAEKVILLPAEEYFKNREKDVMDYRDLYIGIASMQDLNLPIQSTKHYWLTDDLDKARRAIRKINIDVPIVVMDLEQYLELTAANRKEPGSVLQRMKRYIEDQHQIPIEIKRVFYLLEQGEKINVFLEVTKYGYAITFHEHSIIGYSHVTDELLNIVYYESADQAIKQIDPLKVFINCHISIRFTDTARISPTSH